MSKTVNRVFLMGHLGDKPELVMSKAGRPYSRLRVATQRAWTNQDDRREEKTDWHSVFVWGQLAERCCKYLGKGSLVYVEGSLSYWQVAAGNPAEGYKNAIHGYSVKFLSYGKFTETPDTKALP